MKTTSTVFFLSLLIGIWGCASVRVASDYDDEVDFSQYKTFGWMEKSDTDAGATQSLLDKRIIEAIEARLVAKGYQKQTSDDPDLLVDYFTSVDEKIILPRRGDGTGRGMGQGRRGPTQTYTEGTLIVDMVDPKLDQTVWRGWAISAVDEHDESEETVRAFVEALLEKFPPQ